MSDVTCRIPDKIEQTLRRVSEEAGRRLDRLNNRLPPVRPVFGASLPTQERTSMD